MGLTSTALLYINTVKHMKASQIYNRIKRSMHLNTPLKTGYAPSNLCFDASKIALLPILDFDEDFISRFDADSILNDRLSILHHEELIDWDTCWSQAIDTALWTYNLNYFEYLLPLVKAYRDTSDEKYLNKSIEIIDSFISANSNEHVGVCYDPYPISLRLIVWLSFYGYVGEYLPDDFKERFISSIEDQYIWLTQHLELDLLANHYFENLKTIIIVALVFGDMRTFEIALSKFKEQLNEQILDDGMHFELSVMYQNIIFEDILRVKAYFDKADLDCKLLDEKVIASANCSYSLQKDIECVPLFGDAGNNVAKKCTSLWAQFRELFGIDPVEFLYLKDSGYAVLKNDDNDIRVLVKGRSYIYPYAVGHSRNDAGSFEVYIDGKPFVVNAGTFAYQCEERSYFRSNEASNSVTINKTEFNQCWSNFRIAKLGSSHVKDFGKNYILMSCINFEGKCVIRSIELDKNYIMISDVSQNANVLCASLHLSPAVSVNVRSLDTFEISGNTYDGKVGELSFNCLKSNLKLEPYSFGLGLYHLVDTVVYSGRGRIQCNIPLRREIE